VPSRTLHAGKLRASLQRRHPEQPVVAFDLLEAAEFYEEEVEEMIKGLTSLMEPFIMVVLGLTIGSIMIAMYLPIFKLGSVV